MSERAARGALSDEQVEELNRLLAEVAVRAMESEASWDAVVRALRGLAAPAPAGGPPSRREYQHLRAVWARHLFDRGFGRVLGLATFEEYLAGVPEAIPPRPEETPFDRLVLADGRVLSKVGLAQACALLGIACETDEKALVDSDASMDVRWIWCRLGRRPPRAVGEVGLTAWEGACLWAQAPDVLHGGDLFLTGTAHPGKGEYAVLVRSGTEILLRTRPSRAEDTLASWATRLQALP